MGLVDWLFACVNDWLSTVLVDCLVVCMIVVCMCLLVCVRGCLCVVALLVVCGC